MHERISVNNICFPDTSLATQVDYWRLLKAQQIGIIGQYLLPAGADSCLEPLLRTQCQVATVVHAFMYPRQINETGHWQQAQAALIETLRTAKRVGSPTVYITTGGHGSLIWEQAAEAFCEAIAPCAHEARNLGIELLIETAAIVYAEMHMAHSLRDTVVLAEQADIGVCIDIFACWGEAGLHESIKRAMPRCHLVQVSDYVLGDRALPSRAVPGDGVIPLPTIIEWILEAGYDGTFDLELIGPRIDQEGHVAAVRRAADNLGELLMRLGV